MIRKHPILVQLPTGRTVITADEQGKPPIFAQKKSQFQDRQLLGICLRDGHHFDLGLDDLELPDKSKPIRVGESEKFQ